MALLDFKSFVSDNVDLTNAEKTDLLDHFVLQYGYEENIDDGEGKMIPNPISKSETFNQKVTDFIVQTTEAHRLKVKKDAVEITKQTLEAV